MYMAPFGQDLASPRGRMCEGRTERGCGARGSGQEGGGRTPEVETVVQGAVNHEERGRQVTLRIQGLDQAGIKAKAKDHDKNNRKIVKDATPKDADSEPATGSNISCGSGSKVESHGTVT